MWEDDLQSLNFEGRMVWQCSLAELSYLKMGGAAETVCYPRHEQDLQELLQLCHRHDVPVYVMGNGSNVLFSDEGWPGVMILLRDFETNVCFEEDSVTFKGDMRLERFMALWHKQNRTGIEFLTGVPGYVMASIFGNAGAGSQAIGDLVCQLSYMDAQGQLKTLKGEQLTFTYRKGPLKEFGVICKASLRTDNAERALIQSKFKECWDYRYKTQPLKEASLGCVFKNPQGLYASQLIDQAGLKNLAVGDVEVSPMHANFFINRGVGSAKDFWNLIQEVRERVERMFGVFLELEIKTVGL